MNERKKERKKEVSIEKTKEQIYKWMNDLNIPNSNEWIIEENGRMNEPVN